MSSVQVLLEFLEDINVAKEQDKESTIIELITARLDKTLDTYISTLNKDSKYLRYRNSIKLAKRLSK